MPGDNIYPDLSNDKFDIQYSRLMGLPSDLAASIVTGETGPDPVIKTPDDTTSGLMRFGVAGEDDTAGQNRVFDMAGYSFALNQLGNNHFLVDPPNGLYQLGAVPVPGSESGLSYAYLEIDDTANTIKLQAPEGIILPGYGYGNHSGTATFNLAVDAGGNLIEVTAGGGGGSGTVNSGLFRKAAYYITNPSGTVIDDWIGVEFGNTNLNTKIIQQATGDVGLEIKGIASQTGNYFNISSSASTADVLAVLSSGQVNIGKTSGLVLKLGDNTNTSTPTPVNINMGGTVSSVAGQNLKVILWDGGGGASTHFGVGVSEGSLDYCVPSNSHHSMYVGTTNVWFIDSSKTKFIGNHILEFDATLGTKIKLYSGTSYEIGIASSEIYYNVNAGGSHNIKINNASALLVTSSSNTELAGTLKVGSISQDDTEDKIVVWNDTDKILEWRDAATLGGGGGGTVTDFIFTDANGFNGTVTTSTTTPTLELTTTLTAGSVFFAGASGAINEDNSNFFFDNTNNRLGIGRNSSFAASRLDILDDVITSNEVIKVASSSAAMINGAKGIHSIMAGTATFGSTVYAVYGDVSGMSGGTGHTAIRGVGGTGNGVWGTSTSGFSVLGQSGASGVLGSSMAGYNSSSGNGVYAESTSGTGLRAQGATEAGNFLCPAASGIGVYTKTTSASGLPLSVQMDFPTSPDSGITTIAKFAKSNGGTVASGVGLGIDFYQSSDSASRFSTQIASRFITVTDADRTSQFLVATVTDEDTHNSLIIGGPQSWVLSRDAGTNQTDERYSVVGTYKTLTESSATAFVRVNIPSGTATGGEILITVEANDATDYQSRTLRFIWSAVNKAGTITATVQTAEEAVAVSTGTLTVSIDTNDAGSGNLDFRANAVSSLTQTILRCSYQVFKNIGTGTITPQ